MWRWVGIGAAVVVLITVVAIVLGKRLEKCSEGEDDSCIGI